MTDKTAQLNELIEIIRDGQRAIVPVFVLGAPAHLGAGSSACTCGRGRRTVGPIRWITA